MTASELRELAEHIKWYSGQIWSPDDSRKLAVAAELIELVAWAEEAKLPIERLGSLWWVRRLSTSDTLIDALRLAKEASRGCA